MMTLLFCLSSEQVSIWRKHQIIWRNEVACSTIKYNIHTWIMALQEKRSLVAEYDPLIYRLLGESKIGTCGNGVTRCHWPWYLQRSSTINCSTTHLKLKIDTCSIYLMQKIFLCTHSIYLMQTEYRPFLSSTTLLVDKLFSCDLLSWLTQELKYPSVRVTTLISSHQFRPKL